MVVPWPAVCAFVRFASFPPNGVILALVLYKAGKVCLCARAKRALSRGGENVVIYVMYVCLVSDV